MRKRIICPVFFALILILLTSCVILVDFDGNYETLLNHLRFSDSYSFTKFSMIMSRNDYGVWDNYNENQFEISSKGAASVPDSMVNNWIVLIIKKDMSEIRLEAINYRFNTAQKVKIQCGDRELACRGNLSDMEWVFTEEEIAYLYSNWQDEAKLQVSYPNGNPYLHSTYFVLSNECKELIDLYYFMLDYKRKNGK